VILQRLFFGLELPKSWKDELKSIQSSLQSRHIEAGGWTNPDLLHITVLFLGMVAEEQLPAVMEAGRAAAERSKPIRLTTGDFGQFSRNQVFWLGLDRNKTDWDALAELHRQVKLEILARLPMDLDEKHYRPHITIARKLKGRVDVTKLKNPPSLSTSIGDLCLFESLRVDGQLTYPIRARFGFESDSPN
jgi:2'-5' RNA ligase